MSKLSHVSGGVNSLRNTMLEWESCRSKIKIDLYRPSQTSKKELRGFWSYKPL